jgi:hypothetical protein
VVRRAGGKDRGRSGGLTRCPSSRPDAARDPARGARGDFEASRGAGRPWEGTRGLGWRAAQVQRVGDARPRYGRGHNARRRGAVRALRDAIHCALFERKILQNFE